jgi:hypothetical protein
VCNAGITIFFIFFCYSKIDASKVVPSSTIYDNYTVFRLFVQLQLDGTNAIGAYHGASFFEQLGPDIAIPNPNRPHSMKRSLTLSIHYVDNVKYESY